MLGGLAHVVVEPQFKPLVVEQVGSDPVGTIVPVEGLYGVPEKGVRKVPFLPHLLDFPNYDPGVDHLLAS